MSRKNKVLFFLILIGLISTTLVVTKMIVTRESQSVLGDISELVLPSSPSPDQTHFNTVVPSATPPIQSGPQLARSAPSVSTYEIAIVSAPKEVIEENNAAFTWQISGRANTIHTTTIYYGTTSIPGTLSTNVTPGETHYTDVVKDFIRGDYRIPLRFIGNAIISPPGTYFYRAYALIDGKHYWTPEQSFVVKPKPRHEIKIIDPPRSVSAGENVAFTWDVFGPSATTGFTAIVGGKESKPGTFESSVDLPATPYSILVNDFISGTYNVPLRFVGNTKITDPGVYYFRALAFINGKNIWSDEYSLTVQ
ncbi:hypothetical protein HY410_00335 [Candidatus Gottesmanbacteria bacterium]|nr:hypothetical protein [Candidatus Gottesmanbacteria bacterium]